MIRELECKDQDGFGIDAVVVVGVTDFRIIFIVQVEWKFVFLQVYLVFLYYTFAALFFFFIRHDSLLTLMVFHSSNGISHL